MPYIIRPKGTTRRLCGALVGVLAALTIPAAASACSIGATSQPFANYGDLASYVLVEGGSFEGNTSGWALQNARIVNSNWGYEGSYGSRGLEIAPGGSAVSPAVCVSTQEPTFRFFMREAGAGDSQLLVTVRWESERRAHEIVSTISSASYAWGPSPVMGLANVMSSLTAGQSVNAHLVFSVDGAGSWEVDDVYIDPYTR